MKKILLTISIISVLFGITYFIAQGQLLRPNRPGGLISPLVLDGLTPIFGSPITIGGTSTSTITGNGTQSYLPNLKTDALQITGATIGYIWRASSTAGVGYWSPENSTTTLGTGSTGQVAFWTASSTLGGSTNFLFNSGTNELTLNGGHFANEMTVGTTTPTGLFSVSTSTLTAIYVDANNGDVGFGTTTPTAQIQLRAGTSTPHGAPLKLTPGPLLATPEQGALEFNGSELYFTTNNEQRSINLISGIVTTSTTVVATTTETTIYTEPFATSSISVGKMFHIDLYGRYSTGNSSDYVTLNYYVDGVKVISSQSFPKNVTNAPWKTELTCTFRSLGVTGTISCYAAADYNNTGSDSIPTSATVINTNTAADFYVKAQWSAATAGNSLTVTQGHTEIH